MFARKSIYAIATGTLLAASVPAFADHDRWDRDSGYRHDRAPSVEYRRYPPSREVVVERRVERRVVERPIYVERPVYEARPAPVYYPPVYEPAPVYHRAPVYGRGPNVVGTAAGAIVGAAIGSQVGYGHDRAVTTAVGAVIGGAIGSQF